MNIELLEKVEQKLRRMRHKQHFDMQTWGEKNQCGTTACIAGHALLMEGYEIHPMSDEIDPKFISPKGRIVFPPTAARRILSLTHAQAERLFFSCDWPDEFDDSNHNDPRVAADRIRHFINTKGKE